MPTQEEIEAAEESSGLVTESNTIEETTIGTAAIEANANQFKYILLEKNVLKDDINEIYNVEAYASHEDEDGELVRDYDNDLDEALAQDDREYVVRHSDEHSNIGAMEDGGSGARNNSTPVSTAIDHSNNEVAKAIHPIAAAEVFTRNYLLPTDLKDLGIKVVEQALKDFRAGVAEDAIKFPNTTSYKGARVNKYLQTIACTPGTTPWGTGAVATWFDEVGAELPPGMDTAAATKYQRSSIAGWLNWARDTNHFALSPMIGSAVVIGTKVAKTHKKNKAKLIEEVPIALGICQAVLETGAVVCLTTENYTVDEYEILPTQSEINSYLAENPAPFTDDLIYKSAFDLLVLKEGFYPYPYWDIANWRIGYGSSTLTLKDKTTKISLPGDKNYLPVGLNGTTVETIELKKVASNPPVKGADGKDILNTPVVERYGTARTNGYVWLPTNQNSNKTAFIKPSIKITIEQAQYDLERRAKEFYTKRVKSFFTDAQKEFYGPYALAALTSMAYNYGSLPNASVARSAIANGMAATPKTKSYLIKYIIGQTDGGQRADRAKFEANWANQPWIDPTIPGQTTAVNIPGKIGVRLAQVFVNPTKILGYILPKALEITPEKLPDNQTKPTMSEALDNSEPNTNTTTIF